MVVYDVLFKRGEDTKAKWERIGILIEKENGKMSLKLDMVPVGSDWNGWLVVSERKERGEPF